MAKQPPVCRKCGVSHWHFTPCDGVDEYRRVREQAAQRIQENLKPPEGMRMWGDRFTTVERLGENTFVHPRKHIISKNKLTYPKGS